MSGSIVGSSDAWALSESLSPLGPMGLQPRCGGVEVRGFCCEGFRLSVASNKTKPPLARARSASKGKLTLAGAAGSGERRGTRDGGGMENEIWKVAETPEE